MGEHNTDETDPFARLEQTHRRIEERLDQLVRAADDLATGIGPTAALADAEEVAHYLGRGAVRHVEDEEQTLFPALAPHAELHDVLELLAGEHTEHRGIEDQVRAKVASFQGAVPSPESAQELAHLARHLREIYAEHIGREEQDLFPRARRLLSSETIMAMGREMMARRPDRGGGGGRGRR